MAARKQYQRGELFRRYHLPVTSAGENDSESEEINVIDESQAEDRPVKEAEVRGQTTSVYQNKVTKEESKRDVNFYHHGEKVKEVFLDSRVSRGSSKIHQRIQN